MFEYVAEKTPKMLHEVSRNTKKKKDQERKKIPINANN